MPVRTLSGKKKGNKEQDTAKIAVKINGVSGLDGGAAEPEFRPSGTRVPARRNCSAAGRWFAKGPVHIDQVVRVAGKGGYAVAVWLAVRARMDSANGAPATTAWLVKAMGLNGRTVRKAVAALVDIGMLKRDGGEISLPSYMKEN
jgi:hypothetical protein